MTCGWRCVAIGVLLAGFCARAGAEWIPVSEDASVISHSPDTNYNNYYPGYDPLWSGAFYKTETPLWFLTRFYLKFVLREIQPDEYIAAAKLYGYYWDSDDGHDPKLKHDIYFVSVDTWTETGITWGNQPLLTPVDSPIAALDPAIQPLGWVTWDITSTVAQQYAPGDNKLSLMFKVNNEALQEKTGAYFTESETSSDCSFGIYLDVRTVPAPPVLVGLLSMGLTGLVALVWRRRRRAASA